jgi:hypothetical protein
MTMSERSIVQIGTLRDGLGDLPTPTARGVLSEEILQLDRSPV